MRLRSTSESWTPGYRLRSLALGWALLATGAVAHADLWVYMDEGGAMHFASERIDARYQLFFKDAPTDEEEAPTASGLAGGSGSAGAAGAVSGLPSGARGWLTYLDISPHYKSVRHHVRAAAEQYGVEYELLKAMIATESGFDARAVSPKGAVGLMQIMPTTAGRFGVAADRQRTVEQKLTDPAVNVPTGARYLRYLLDLFPGRMDLALAAYNAGEGAVQRHGHQIPPFKETQNYVRTVLALYAQLKPWGSGPGARAAPARPRSALPGGAFNRGNLPPDRLSQTPGPTEPASNE